MKKNKRLEVKVGIYDTCITYVEHRDKSITVTTPYIQWTQSCSTGKLQFEKQRFTGKRAEKIKEFFDKNTLILDDENYNAPIDLTDVLNGEYRDLDS